MIFRLLLASSFLLGITPSLVAQKLKKADRLTLSNLESSVHFLADDKLEGRRAGTAGEKLASDFITESFKQAGLQPWGTDHGWLQSFEIYDGKQIEAETRFAVNNQDLQLNKEYFPLAYSALKKVEGMPAIALQESGVPWFLDLKDILEQNRNNPHFDLDEAIVNKARDLAKKGATALVLYNTSKIEDNLAFRPKDKTPIAVIPILYVTRDAKRKYLRDESASLDIKINVALKETGRTGHNVIGYLDNHAATTLIIGAHYDHLGYGEDNNSLYRGEEKQIHNGADDNASGTAGVIELARLIKNSKFKKHNYLFIAFSGEELGLFGSKYFVEHPTIDLANASGMINMDMIGRFNDTTQALTIGGYGTSPSWGELLTDQKDKALKNFHFKFDSSGTGPSDYTSFYRKDIPVLFFFTGLHSDYHKPTDDFDKINYTGELNIVKLIFDLVGRLNDMGKLAFTKTREMQTGSSARFSVTLGIMPDYTFSGTGVRVDGVSDGRPAQKAGLKTGDIIVKLGDFPVNSLENYMQALSKFKKGDKTVVNYKRGTEAATAAVEF